MSHACHSSRAGRCWRVRCIPTPHDPLHPPTPLKKAFGIQLPRGQMQTCNINPVFSASSFTVRWRHVTRQFFLASPLHLVTSLIKKLDEGECLCGKGPACFFFFFFNARHVAIFHQSCNLSAGPRWARCNGSCFGTWHDSTTSAPDKHLWRHMRLLWAGKVFYNTRWEQWRW